MKKTLLIIVTVALGCQARAQFNHNFERDGNIWDIANCNNNDFGTLSEKGVKRYDAGGNLLWERKYILPYSPQDSFLTSGRNIRLMHTDDDGFLIFGLMLAGTTTSRELYAVAVKLDAAGSLVWSKRYNRSYHSGAFLFNPSITQVNGTRMAGASGSEQYLFTYSAGPDDGATGNYRHAVMMCAMSIDAATGTLGYMNRYYAPYGSGTYAEDYPQSVTYAGEDPVRGPVYYISGACTVHNATDNGVINGGQFRMTIDQNGNIVSNYRVYSRQGTPFLGHAVYDPATKTVLDSYTMGPTGITGGSEKSVMAVQSVDMGLNTVWGRYYWNPNSTENYTDRIALSGNNSEYVVHGYFVDNEYYSTTDPIDDGVNTPTLLKIDGKGSPVFYKHYIKDELVSGDAIGLIVNNTGAGENYIFGGGIGSPIIANSPGAPVYTYARLFGTDVNGDVCGSLDAAIENKALPESAPTIYNYRSQLDNYTYDLPVIEVPTHMDFDNCNYWSVVHRPANTVIKPTALSTAASEAPLHVFPTLVTDQDGGYIHVAVPPGSGEHAIQITAVDGKRVLNTSIAAGADATPVALQVGQLLPGNYFIRIVNTTTQISRTFRFSKL